MSVRPPPLVHSLLVSNRRLKYLRRRGCWVAFWETQSCVSDGCMAKWKDQHWKHVTDCHQGVTSFSANTPSPLFLPVSPPSCLSASLFVWPSDPSLRFSLPRLPSTNQGSEEGWSDYRRTAEEDREQPQSPRFPRQEWTSTCLKDMNSNKRKQQRPVCRCGC